MVAKSKYFDGFLLALIIAGDGKDMTSGNVGGELRYSLPNMEVRLL